jgi:hypothetical protein
VIPSAFFSEAANLLIGVIWQIAADREFQQAETVAVAFGREGGERIAKIRRVISRKEGGDFAWGDRKRRRAIAQPPDLPPLSLMDMGFAIRSRPPP